MTNPNCAPSHADDRSRAARPSVQLTLILLSAACVQVFAAGSFSGVVKDPTGAAPAARLTLINTILKTEFKAASDARGFYSFPALLVGHYDLTFDATGFQTEQKTNLTVDTDAALRIDTALQVGQRSQAVTVTESAEAIQTQVATVATHLGDVVSGKQMEALPLNGRSYTDLLAIQPGVTPVTTLTPASVIMAGVTGTINPSGDLNPGNVSIDGQRESSNGFMMNSIDVQEHMKGGTSVIPNLDSILQFRVPTNNFDAEYGNYNGGMINVVTKSGSDAFHGDAFEFLRNTRLDARNFFDNTRGAFRQNQFGGVIGGPIKKDRVFSLPIVRGPARWKASLPPKLPCPRCQIAPAILRPIRV
jgi:Carboxypeptidase regulatory-like domain